jgi:hypothetical protein
MSSNTRSDVIDDPVPKIDNELAVGENIEFQRRWWSFMRGVYVVFCLIMVLDLLGAFGRGYLAENEVTVSGGAAKVKYERIERTGTPSILSLQFAQPNSPANSVAVWMSKEITQDLGNQRIIPQPAASTLHSGGILYKFPISAYPARSEFALQPAHPGVFTLKIRVNDGPESSLRIVVLP